MCAGSSLGLESGKSILDFAAAALEEAGELQALTERCGGFVDGESGLVSCDLEQDTTGFAEVDRAEIVAVLLLRRVPLVCRYQLLSHCGLLRVIRCAEGDVMHRATSLMPSR